MTTCHLNSTDAYHRNSLGTLGWELTLCNALYPDDSPCRGVLKRNVSYGEHLYDYLDRFISMKSIHNIIEIGGGYGYLMKAFFEKEGSFQVSMIDISPYLIGRQRHTLQNFPVHFLEADFLDLTVDNLLSFELAILNENLGDFPTLVGLHTRLLNESSTAEIDAIDRARYFIDRYELDFPEDETFNLNIGALAALEKCCIAGIPNIFLGEHSCEARVPECHRRYIKIVSTGYPQCIPLYGHNEYTVKFSHLEKIALAFGYKIIRGPFADILPFEWTDSLKYILKSSSANCEQHEIIRHFLNDLFQYEYLLLTTGSSAETNREPSGKDRECI